MNIILAALFWFWMVTAGFGLFAGVAIYCAVGLHPHVIVLWINTALWALTYAYLYKRKILVCNPIYLHKY